MREDFPILAREHKGQPLIYLDSAATTQKPQVVIDAITKYYTHYNSNVHRAAHILAEEATAAMEDARNLVQAYIGATDRAEIIFTRGTTEAINLLAYTMTNKVAPGDEILITELEHHSNIVPWQLLCQRTGAQIKAVKVTATGDIDLDDFHSKLCSNTKILACSHVSNALGSVNPIEQMISAAKSVGAYTVIDGAQAVLHETVDVQALDCDFYAFSGHKMYAPTGIGVLFGKLELLDDLPPWHGGGEMIEHVTIKHSTYQKPPYKFEAGTPHIAGIVGLGAAISYLNSLPRQSLIESEKALVSRTISQLKQIPGVKLVGEPKRRSAVISFLVDGAHPNDIGTLLDQQAVAVRTGHHCAMPLMNALGVPGTIRASFSLYSNESDANAFLAAVNKAITFI